MSTARILLAAALAVGVSAWTSAQPAPATQPAANAPQTATTAPAAAAAPADDWLTQMKKPLPWLKFEGDFRARDEYSNNVPGLNKNTVGHERHYQRYRTRIGATVTPVENLDINARVAWEFFNYCKPESLNDFDGNEALFDKLNVTWKKTFGLPNTLVVGRQEITDLGGGWLILDGTPLDGSRTIFFDAIRDTLEIPDAKTTVDLIYVQQYASEEKYIEPFSPSRDRYFVENDERGFIAWAKNKSIERTQLDGFYIFRDTEAVTPRGYNSSLHTFGGGAEHAFDDHWILRGMLAEQLGDREGENVYAQAFHGRLTYKFRDKWDTDAYTGYEFLSGNDPDSGHFEQFDPLWGRWPQFSEILSSVYTTETLPGQVTNLHRVYWGAITRPKPFEFALNYHLLFADQNYEDRVGYSETGCFRGQLITAVWRWEINKHMATQLLGEAYFPGDFYTDLRNDVAIFARYEIVFKW